MARDLVMKNPGDNDLQQNLVTAELVAGNLEEAKRLAAAMEIVDPHDISALMAAAKVALAEKRPNDAISRLERIVDAKPRDLTARFLLITAYNEISNKAKVAEHLAQYSALGGKMPKGAADR
jgi:Flp pilus assembly protein TadD